jgi:putative acetyltransferase
MIRAETAADVDAIRKVLMAAFPGPGEAKLVDDLRSAGDLVLSLVADEGGIVGHVAFSRTEFMALELRGTALAPIGVLPGRQRTGVGSALVREGLLRLAQAGEDLVLVVGDPGFYERFGFNHAAAARLRTPYDGPYLLAKALSGQGRQAHGEVRYSPAVAALE